MLGEDLCPGGKHPGFRRRGTAGTVEDAASVVAEALYTKKMCRALPCSKSIEKSRKKSEDRLVELIH